MAAPKKKTTVKAKPASKPKTAPAKTAPAKRDDLVQETIDLLKGFQLHTLIAIGLGLAFVLIQFFDKLSYIWLLNFAVAASAGYLFWRQDENVKGIEAKVCRYGLLAVVAVFFWRDYQISQTLYDLSQGNFNLNDLVSG